MSPILCNLDRENKTVIASRTQVVRASSRSRAMIVTQIFSQLNEVTISFSNCPISEFIFSIHQSLHAKLLTKQLCKKL